MGALANSNYARAKRDRNIETSASSARCSTNKPQACTIMDKALVSPKRGNHQRAQRWGGGVQYHRIASRNARATRYRGWTIDAVDGAKLVPPYKPLYPTSRATSIHHMLSGGSLLVGNFVAKLDGQCQEPRATSARTVPPSDRVRRFGNHPGLTTGSPRSALFHVKTGHGHEAAIQVFSRSPVRPPFCFRPDSLHTARYFDGAQSPLLKRPNTPRTGSTRSLTAKPTETRSPGPGR